MKSYSVLIEQEALKFIESLRPADRIRIVKKINSLAENPRPFGYLKLKGRQELSRVRSGNFRILYTIVDARLVVIIVRINDRKDVYKDH